MQFTKIQDLLNGNTGMFHPKHFNSLNGSISPSASNRNSTDLYFNDNSIINNKRSSNDQSFSKKPDILLNKQEAKRFSYDNKSNFNTTLPQRSNPQGSLNTKIPIVQKTFSAQQIVSSPSSDSIFQKNLELNLLKIQHRKIQSQNQSQKQTITKLRQQLSQKAQMLKKFNQLMKIKYNQLKQIKSQSEQKDKKILQLTGQMSKQLSLEQSNKLKQELFITKKNFDQLNQKVNNLDHQNFRNQVYQMKISKLYEELSEQKTKQTNHFLQMSNSNQKIKQLQQKVADLQYQLQKGFILNRIQQFEKIHQLFKSIQNTSSSSSPSKNNKQQTTHLAAFDQALKVQIKHIQQLKQTIQSSKQVIQKLRDNLISSRKQLQQLRGEIKIMQLKYNTQRKKLIMQYRLQIHQKDNEINSSFKRFKTLEDKYKNSIQEIKVKDEFLKQHLVGRTNDGTIHQYIENILKEYIQEFGTINGLKSQNKQLNQRLDRYRKYEIIESN